MNVKIFITNLHFALIVLLCSNCATLKNDFQAGFNDPVTNYNMYEEPEWIIMPRTIKDGDTVIYHEGLLPETPQDFYDWNLDFAKELSYLFDKYWDYCYNNDTDLDFDEWLKEVYIKSFEK